MHPIQEATVIMGAGGLAREALTWFHQSRGYYPSAFYCDVPAEPVIEVGGYRFPVTNNLEPYRRLSFLVAVGNPELRQRFYQMAVESGLTPCMPVMHPSAVIANCKVKRGSLVGPQCVLSDRVVVFENVYLNLACTLGHDAIVGAHSHLAPMSCVSGGVEIAPMAYVGAQSVIREKIQVGARAIIGMGAVVTKQVPADAVVVGNPARERLRAVSETVGDKHV